MNNGVEFNASVDFDESAVKKRFAEKTKKAQMKLDVQVLNDSNFFCPLKESFLQKSAIENTVMGSGTVCWKTPYAKSQYYGLDFDHSKSRNPNATAKWFESAKARKLKQWEKLVEDEFKHR